MYLDVLRTAFDRQTDVARRKDTIDKLQSASNKIESVIRRVMDFSKPNKPQFVLKCINQPIEETLKLSSVTLRKSGIKVKKSLAEELPLCQIDPHLIEEILLNLLNNAAEAMKNMNGNKKIEVLSLKERIFALVRRCWIACFRPLWTMNLDYIVGKAETIDRHPGKLPGVSKLHLKLIYARYSHTLLGAQMYGGDSVGELVNMFSVMILN